MFKRDPNKPESTISWKFKIKDSKIGNSDARVYDVMQKLSAVALDIFNYCSMIRDTKEGNSDRGFREGKLSFVPFVASSVFGASFYPKEIYRALTPDVIEFLRGFKPKFFFQQEINQIAEQYGANRKAAITSHLNQIKEGFKKEKHKAENWLYAEGAKIDPERRSGHSFFKVAAQHIHISGKRILIDIRDKDGTPISLPINVFDSERLLLLENQRKYYDNSQGSPVGNSTVYQDKRGTWWISISVTPFHTKNPSNKITGVDVGLETFAACSDGKKFPICQYFRKSEEKLAKLQSRQSRGDKTKRHQSWKKIAKLSEHIKNQRKNTHHAVAKEIVDTNGFIRVEGANASSMRKNKKGSAASRRGKMKSVYDAGWSYFRDIVAYKAQMQDKEYKEIEPYFTTQTCSGCWRRTGPKTQDIREWTCSFCGSHHDRDRNAAKVIAHVPRRPLTSSKKRVR